MAPVVRRLRADRQWYENLVAGGELALTGQDRLLISLLSPDRLLEMTRYYLLHDQRYGKIVARYQQVFSIKRLIERIIPLNISSIWMRRDCLSRLWS